MATDASCVIEMTEFPDTGTPDNDHEQQPVVSSVPELEDDVRELPSEPEEEVPRVQLQPEVIVLTAAEASRVRSVTDEQGKNTKVKE